MGKVYQYPNRQPTPKRIDPATKALLVEKLSDQDWRLNNLYQITDEYGQLVPFRMRWAQEQLYKEMHYLNIVLKSRQLGFTTFIDLLFLDTCLFNGYQSAGIIAHHKEDASKIFREKILLPFRHCPKELQSALDPEAESKLELALPNYSSIRVGTSMRSGTLQYLHVSEYGFTCYKYPEKALEIRTGALNTVQAGQIVFIESTAKGGKIGHFYELWDQAYAQFKAMSSLSKLDWKIFFFPWWLEPKYELDPKGVVIGPQDEDYFLDLAARENVVLSDRKKAWYVSKKRTQGVAMRQEYPSTISEAWESGGLLLNWNERYHECEELPIPHNAVIIMGYDHGFAKPFSCGWYWVDYDGRLYRFREWYGWDGLTPNQGMRLPPGEIAQGIRKKEEQWGIWGRVTRRIAGGDIFSRTINVQDGYYGPTVAEMMQQVEPGIVWERAQDKSRKNCVMQYHERLKIDFNDDGQPTARPMFQVYKLACPQFLRTVPSIPSDPLDPEDANTDAEDHAFDESKYVFMSRQMATRQPEREKSLFEQVIERAEREGGRGYEDDQPLYFDGRPEEGDADALYREGFLY